MLSNNLTVLVLAGGKGTRIKSILGPIPKLLAPINDIPFFEYFLRWLKNSLNNINFELIVSSGIGHGELVKFFANNYSFVKLIKEKKPLGTLGAVLNAFRECKNDNLLILNGDTIFDVCLKSVFLDFLKFKCSTLHVVKKSNTNERYGGYKIVNGFLKYTEQDPKYISMGATLVNKEKLYIALDKKLTKNGPLMMDKDFISKYETKAYILEDNINFIDIGTPKSFADAQIFIPSFFKNN